MLPLPAFTLHTPRSLDEALTLLDELGPEAALIAGGTDVLPAMKLELLRPRHLVSLSAVAELRGVERADGQLRVGAMTSLAEIAESEAIAQGASALQQAALSVGGPHHRAMGTLGGNLCLDTRCRYFNQSRFWRGALGFCLKKDGDRCHVVAGGKHCVAAASNDTAAAAIALGGELLLAGPRGRRLVAAQDFYTADGVANTTRGPDEILVELRLPTRPGRQSAYEKLRRRKSIDFPLLSVAARVDVEGGRVVSADLVVSALAARPRRVEAAFRLAEGLPPGEVPISTIADEAYRVCRPLENIEGDAAWRREMVPVLVRRALVRAGLGPPR